MSFKERAANAPTKPLCAVGAIVDSLPEDEAEALCNMLAADLKTWPHTGPKSIQEAFEEEGYGRIDDRAIRSHRARRCRCQEGISQSSEAA